MMMHELNMMVHIISVMQNYISIHKHRPFIAQVKMVLAAAAAGGEEKRSSDSSRSKSNRDIYPGLLPPSSIPSDDGRLKTPHHKLMGRFSGRR